MPSIPAAHEARNLLISFNRQLGPRQVLKDMSHATTLARRPRALVRGPSCSSCPWL